MRFTQLKTGQRFSFEGKRYAKTGPLTASEEESGENRMIRRSAEVTPLGGAEVSVEPVIRNYTHDDVMDLLRCCKMELRERLLKAGDESDVMVIRDVLSIVEALDPAEVASRVRGC